MDQNQRETDSQTSEVAGTDFLISRAQNHQHEEECGDDLHEAGAQRTTGIGNAVRAKTHHAFCNAFCRRGDDVNECQQDSTGNDTADDLALSVVQLKQDVEP